MKPMYVALLLFTSFLWSGNFVVGKFLVNHASSMTLTNLRYMIAVVVLIPVVYLAEKRLLPPRRAILPLILMGATGVVLFNLFMFWALERTAATNVGLLSTLNPISIAIFSFLLLREKIKFLQIGSMILCFTGVLLVLSKGDWHALLSLRFNSGDLWMLAAVATWGLYSVAGRWAMRDVSALMSTLYSGFFGVLMLLPFNLSSFTITDFNAEFIWGILYISVFATVISMVLWNMGVKQLGGTAAGMFLNFNPIFTAILALLLLDEQMTWTQVYGSLIVILGCFSFTRLRNISLPFEKKLSNLKDNS
ncbi:MULTISPECIES: DMT family transporter [Brevibacillus]|uniref:DMT family transporter n=1 Tax=Brevibacillus TaxID=55080 RepID=UPI000B9A2CC9|nr:MULTISPECIES: DMT family transporter [Brevibacillus]MBG9786765.1 transporter [Brevibacillus laterosporus]MCG7319257.1 DMT family transporter [Brevibacillus laterosporus]RFB32076.1 DMT family transporter [Brevibacillus sp. VP]